MIVVDNAPEVKGYIERSLGIVIPEPTRVMGFMSDAGRPLCAVAFSEFNFSNIELTIVSEPGGLTRAVMRHVATYTFIKLGCRRITVRTKRRNKLAAKMAIRFGFTFEAPSKHFFGDDDALVYRMLKADCPWLSANSKQATS